MMRRRGSLARALVASVLAACPPAATASLDGSASILVIPIVAKTASYTSIVTVRNPNSYALDVLVEYVGGSTAGGGASAAPGFRDCGIIGIPASGSIEVDIGQKCSLPSAQSDSNFGSVYLTEQGPIISPIQAYSRVQNPQGIGFSVPAFPMGALEVPRFGHYVIGLKRKSGAPGYQTNCFVATLDEPSPYQIRLLTGSGAKIGNARSGTLTVWELVRILDIFGPTGVNAPAGDYSNVTAEFTAPGSSGAALLGFCTVQDNTSFGADFRMAQPVDPSDRSRERFASASSAIDGSGSQVRWRVFLRQPDYVQCSLDAASADKLELRMRDPTGAAVAGGDNQSDTGIFHLGARSQFAGWSDLWYLEVGPRESYAGPFPVAFDILCDAGQGLGLATPGIVTDDF